MEAITMEPIDTLFGKLSSLHEDIIDTRLRNTIVATALSEYLQAQPQQPTHDPLALSVWELAHQVQQDRDSPAEHHLKVCLAPFAIEQPAKPVTAATRPRARYLALLKWILEGRRDGERPDQRGRPRGTGFPERCRYLYEHRSNHQQCAKCGTRPAALRCDRCLITEGGGHPVVVTFYCSVGCQAADMCYHREVCQPLRRFHRAARLVRDLYDAVAEATYVNGPVDTICADEDGIVHVARSNCLERILRGGSMVVPFERDRFHDLDHAAAALYDIRGPHQTQATSAGRSFLNMFIRTQCAHIREVHFRPKNAAFGYASTAPVRVGRGYGPVYSMLETHGVFVATLKTGHEIVIDVAGRQYGWREPMALWHDYLQVRCHQITHETRAIGHACREFRHAEGFFSPHVAVRHLRRAVMARAVNEVMAFVLREHKSFFRLLRQPDATYQAAHDTAVAIAKTSCAKEVDANNQLGLFRFFRLFNGGVKVTRSWEHAAQMQNMWLTDEEVHSTDDLEADERSIRLVDIYEGKVRDYYTETGVDVTQQFDKKNVSTTTNSQPGDNHDDEGVPIPSSPTLGREDDIVLVEESKS
ncbi:hypothetical protein F4810DRAFT_723500 [Camillea tinctor]|nr:hypothetical protein F4810DRAFT_723500 [Camillea tinctor]